MTKKSIFRAKALQHYQVSQVRKVVPKFLSPARIFFFWALFILLIGGAIVIWSYSPVHIEQGTGILRHVTAKALPDYGLTSHGSNAQIIAILLLPSSSKTLLQTGNTVQIQPDGTQQSFAGNIQYIDTTTQTVAAARSRYHLSDQVLSNIPSSIVVAIVGFDSSQQKTYDDKQPITGNVQIPIPSILYLFLSNINLPGTG